jgi:hypothetical protein
MFVPGFADEFVGCETLQGLEAPCLVVAVEKDLEVPSKFALAAEMPALNGGVRQGALHPLHLAIRPQMGGLGDAMFAALGLAGSRA